MSGSFADTNVLLYLLEPDDPNGAVAVGLLGEGLHISVQVLNEMASVMLGKWRQSWDETDRLLALVRNQATVQPVTELTHDLGIELSKRYLIGIYDSMIVSAALLAGCDTLYSEDMHHGLVVERRLTIVNPFA